MSGSYRFISRWSRLKRQATVTGTAKDLPSLETLAGDADLSAYIGLEVEESLRRQALQRIFSDPGFNVMDGLDVYIGDYSLADPIPVEMLAQMNQARLLFAEDEASEQDGASTGLAAEMAEAPLAGNAAGVDAMPHLEEQHSD